MLDFLLRFFSSWPMTHVWLNLVFPFLSQFVVRHHNIHVYSHGLAWIGDRLGKCFNTAFIVHALCDGVWRFGDVIHICQDMIERFKFGPVGMGMGLVFKQSHGLSF